jgi:dTDP-4-amino-4,6-dideoxygalactose transaminase
MTGIPKIPFFGVDRQYNNLREEILDATDLVYASGQVLDGPKTKLFQQTIAKMTERKYAVAVNSGTQALIFALRALDDNIKLDNVLIPSQSYIATVNSVLEAGFDPVFCDVDPVSGIMDLNTIPLHASNISAMMYVNLFGNILDQERLITYQEIFARGRIPVIEDAAQSFGGYYRGVPSGKLGDISILSFDPTKNLNNYGSGGMILTDNADYAEMCCSLRDNGKALAHNVTGTNSKMSEADCAQMLIKLKYFDQWQARRTEIAEYYTTELDGYVELISIDPNVEHAWSKFVVHHHSRNILNVDLSDKGIETKIHYPIPLHLHPVSYVNNDVGILEGAEQFSRTCLSLPIYPELEDYEVEYVVDAIKQSIY